MEISNTKYYGRNMEDFMGFTKEYEKIWDICTSRYWIVNEEKCITLFTYHTIWQGNEYGH